MSGLSVLNLVQLTNGDLLFSLQAYNIYEVSEPRMAKLGQGVRTWGTLPLIIFILKNIHSNPALKSKKYLHQSTVPLLLNHFKERHLK